MLQSLATAGLAGAALLLPPGYLLLRLGRSPRDGVAGLAAAAAIGYSVVLPLFAAELAIGRPVLVLPAVVASVLLLRPGRDALAGARRLRGGVLLAGVLAALALALAWGDVEVGPGGLVSRLGFDVIDRPYYSTISQELLRAPLHRLQNPMLAGYPLQYALFPALLAGLLQRYGGLDVLHGWVLLLPALGLAFTGLAVAAYHEEEGGHRWATVLVAVALVVLGGDLSFLAGAGPPPQGIERYAHFLTFYSFSAESLTYNPWMFALPLILAGLTLARRFLASGRPGELALAGLVLGALVETKVQACVALAVGAALAAVLRRDRRLAGLTLAIGVGAAPWLALSLPLSGARGGPPLVPAPLSVVAEALGHNPPLARLAAFLGAEPWPPPWHGLPGVAVVVAVFLAGGLGVRLLGLRRLAQSVRRDATGVHALIAASCAVAVVLGLALRGDPNPVDGWQFLGLPLYLLWLYVAPGLGEWTARRGWARPAAVGLLALAMVSPARYLAKRRFPEWLTSPRSADRSLFSMPPPVLDACAFLNRHAAPGEALVVPLRSPADPAGLRTLFVPALSGLRVSASVIALHAAPPLIAARQEAAERLYTTTDSQEGEALLERLGAAWVWEEPSRPLGFASARLQPRYAGAVRLWRVRPAPE